jgi:hypothetical protein
VTQDAKSGKRVVSIMLALAMGVAAIAWFAASRIERDTNARREAAGEDSTGAVLHEGVLYEASAGDPGLLIAKDVASGKELWRAELGSLIAPPSLAIDGELIEVEIAGTPWMTLDRTSGEPVE